MWNVENKPDPIKTYDDGDYDDDQIYCGVCEEFFLDQCPKHRPNVIDDSDVNAVNEPRMYALKTLPKGLIVKKSTIPEAGLGVFAKEKIKINTRFGPFKGKKTEFKELVETEAAYSWKIIDRDTKVPYIINAIDTRMSNWMRYVNCPRDEKEQNLIAYQYRGEVYYTTYKTIKPGTELLIWYGDDYAEGFGTSLAEEERQKSDGRMLFGCPISMIICYLFTIYGLVLLISVLCRL